jgi:hypothetical protein
VGGKESVMSEALLCEKCGEEYHITMESRLYPKHCVDCEEDKHIAVLMEELMTIVNHEWDPLNRIENLEMVIDYARQELN